MESKQQKVLRLVFLSMMIGLGVVISPILRVEGMCPMAHLINITCSVMLGPWYSLLCATLIGIIRMTVMGIPPLALTGAVFGAVLSGIFYRASGGKIIAACLGEVIGTGIIGAMVSYPVMEILDVLRAQLHCRHPDRRFHCLRAPHHPVPERDFVGIPEKIGSEYLSPGKSSASCPGPLWTSCPR